MSEIEDSTGIGNTVTWVMTGPDGKVKSTGTAEIEVKANDPDESDGSDEQS